jgi:hypothetical protein
MHIRALAILVVGFGVACTTPNKALQTDADGVPVDLDGSTTSDGAALAGCVKGQVQVEMVPATGEKLCVGTCDGWMSVLDSSGDFFWTPSFMDCVPNCSDCAPVPCLGMACSYQELPAGGLTTSWQGRYAVHGTCGASNTSCQAPRCAAPGHYRARICAYRSAPEGCHSLDTTKPICVEASFDLKASGTTTIRVVLPSEKSGHGATGG